MKIILPIILLLICCQPSQHQHSIKDRLEGIWLTDHQDPVDLGRIEANFEPEYYIITRVVEETDSGLYEYSYKNDSILISVKPYLFVTEYVFDTNLSGFLYGYQLDTIDGPIELPRPREASQTQFKIKQWGSIYRIVCTTEGLKYEVQLRFVDDDQHMLIGKGGKKTVHRRVKYGQDAQ